MLRFLKGLQGPTEHVCEGLLVHGAYSVNVGYCPPSVTVLTNKYNMVVYSP